MFPLLLFETPATQPHFRVETKMSESTEAQLRAQIADLEACNRDLQSENARLKISDARFARLMDADILGIVVADQNGQILEVNAAFLHLLGRSRQEMEERGLDWRRDVPPDEWSRHEEKARLLWTETAVCPPWETRLLRADETEIAVLTGATLLTAPQHQILMWTLDISRLKAAEIQLRAAEAQMRSIVEGLHEGLLITDLNDVVLYANPRLGEMTGHEPSEMVGRVAFELFLPPHEWPLMHERNRSRAHGTGSQYETLMHRKDGSSFWALVNGSALRDAQGKIVGTIGAQSDISERKNAEEKARILTERLEISNRDLQSFAYAVSHDLKEPLRKIEVFGSRLQRDFVPQIGEEAHDYLRRMREASRRMSALIDGLLEYSRITTQGHAFERVDLGALAQTVVADLEIGVEGANAKIEIAALPSVWADPIQMRQLLQNLLANALKYGRESVLPHIQIGGWETPENRGFWVRDNGRGFEPSASERIFEIFARLEGRVAQKNADGTTGGTGVGLTICRKIAERHGGTIAAQGFPGEGALFTVTLPCAPDQTLPNP